MQFSRTGLLRDTRFRSQLVGEFNQPLAIVALCDSGPLNLMSFQHRPKAITVETPLLTPSIQPLLEDARRLAEELVQAQVIPYDSIVVVVTPEFPVQGLKQFP